MKINVNVDLTKVFNYLKLVSYIIKNDYLNFQDKSSKKYNKLQILGQTLDYFLKKHENIQSLIKPRIEKMFNVKFKNPNLITITLFTPSTKNSFIALGSYIQDIHPDLYKEDIFEFMASFGDVAQGLATLGDSALKLSITHILWDDGIIDKGKITKAKEKIEQNSNLAKYCDRLNLFNHMIYVKSKYFDPKPKTIDHIKGTLVESVLGIYYLEKGLPSVLDLIKSLEPQQKEFDKEEIKSDEKVQTEN